MHYTKAIVSLHLLQYKNPDSFILYTNRATAFKKHREWQLMLEDSQRAIGLNQKYFKAFLRKGEALIELGKSPKHQDTKFIDDGIKCINQALVLCSQMDSSDPKFDQKKSFERQLAKQILRAKKIKWFKKKILEKEEKQAILLQF
jgi:tetratricopeptide (TPR) repeat protein